MPYHSPWLALQPPPLKLEPLSQVIRSSHGRVPVGEVLDTHSFNLEEAQQAPGWIAEINAFEAELEHRRAHPHHGGDDHGGVDEGVREGHGADRVHSHGDASSSSRHDISVDGDPDPASGKVHHHRRETETEKYGISSFVYFARRPFHPSRLLEVALSVNWEGVLRTKVRGGLGLSILIISSMNNACFHGCHDAH